MRRGAKGGTTHPTLSRPGYGYGRPLRPRPERTATGRPWLDPRWWLAVDASDADRPSVPSRP
jgi:hypothetical protein